MLIRSIPTRLVPPLAAFKLALGLAAFWATWGAQAGKDASFPYVLYGLLGVAFGGTGALLLLGGREDRRAVNLGAFFLAASTAYSNGPLRYLTEEGGPGSGFFSLVNALELDAFMAFFLWRFVRDFPAAVPSLPGRSRIQLVIRLSAVAAVLLFALNLLGYVAQHMPEGSALAEDLAVAAPRRGRGIYYGVVLPLTIAAFPALLWRARSAQREDQRRARLFLLVLVLSFAPMIFLLLLELSVKSYSDFLHAHPELKGEILLGAILPALTLPITVPYSVLVYRVLDVRLIAQRALQYLMARYTVLALVGVPLAEPRRLSLVPAQPVAR